MPWLDQERIAPFSLLPWAYIFFVIILPGTLVLCAIFFSVAALTRSFAMTFASAMAFFVGEALLNLYAKPENGAWGALADPSARLTVAVETRYWTVTELNTNIPLGLLLQNRLLWLTAPLLALLLTMWRFRLDLAQQAPFRFKRRSRSAATAQRTPQPAIQEITPVRSFSPRASFAQFVSQLKMDLSCVFKSPLIYIILALYVTQMIGEFQNNVGLLNTPLYPLTSQMLPFLRYGMLGNILPVGLWYSAELIHRERASGIGEIITVPTPLA
jgi:ABC-2 type transport system permease protein